MMMTMMIRDHSFPRQIFPNSAGQFAKFRGSPWQIFCIYTILSSLLNGAMLTGIVVCNFQNLHYFVMSALEDEKLIKKQTCTKNEACKLYSRVF